LSLVRLFSLDYYGYSKFKAVKCFKTLGQTFSDEEKKGSFYLNLVWRLLNALLGERLDGRHFKPAPVKNVYSEYLHL
jgi:hypothetical protein